VRELSVAAIAVGDLDLCGELFDELAPLADACGVNGAVVAFAGSHAHTAGLLAGALGRAHESAALLAQARRVYERLGAASWLAELDRAAPPAEPVPTIARGAAMAGLRHVGAVWHVSFGAASAVVPNARGLDDLAALISEPGRDLHALALMGARDTTSRPAGTMVDRAALQRYRQRLADIDDDLAGATRDHDEAATIRLDAERESVLAELRRATSTTGQARQFSNHPAERARKAVSARIRAAIANIDAVLPAMAAHLNDTIVTGTTCRYRGDGNVTWDVTR